MATKVQEIERDGRKIAVYDNGLERDMESGRIVKPASNTLITAKSATELHRRRQEKAAAALRARILASAQKRSDIKLSGSAEAIAEAGGFIWDEVVLGEEVYPRDRLEAWEKLGKYAGVLPADVKRQDSDTAQATQAVSELASIMRDLLDAARAAEERSRAVDGDIVGVDNSNYRKHEDAQQDNTHADAQEN